MQNNDLLIEKTRELEKELALKNRELQIEAALERVRAKTMAMLTSDEIGKIIYQVFSELKNLGVVHHFAQIITDFEPNKDWFNTWYASDEKDHAHFVRYNFFDHPFNKKWKNALKKGTSFYCDSYFKKEKDAWFDGAFRFSDLSFISEERKKLLYQTPGLTRIVSLEKNSSISLMKYNNDEFTEEEKNIIVRFGNQFEQSYTRFLDLKKAEEQAHEAKIEAALERVRSSSLAMHKSEDIRDVVVVVSKELANLNINGDAVNIGLFKPDSKDLNIYTATADINYARIISIPYIDIAFFNKMWEAFLNNPEIYELHLNKEEKDEFIHHALQTSEMKNMPEERKNFIFEGNGLSTCTAGQKNTAISFGNYSKTEFSDHDKNIIIRFSKVFEQAYVRFLDIQKAEEQACEAQIEAALEKVRSRSLAMHKSEELQEVITTVLHRINELGLTMDSATVCLPSEKKKEIVIWIASKDYMYSEGFRVPFGLKSIIGKDIENVCSGENDCFAKQYTKKEKDAYYRDIFEHSDFRRISQDRKNVLMSGGRYGLSAAASKNSAIFTISYSGKILTEAEIEVLKRFARVFEQSYTRFLDLEKAEAHAREAQIEAALERVRSRSLAMHKSDELQEVITVIHQQFNEIGISADHVSINIPNLQLNQSEIWTATPENTYSQKIIIPVSTEGGIVNEDFLDAFVSQKDFTRRYSIEEKNTWWNDVFENSDFGKISEKRKQFLLNAPEWNIAYAITSNAALMAGYYSEHKISESDKIILRRFANVFEQAYTRFLDLQKAEAQADEARIEAALEKVRSRSLAMHKSDELQEVINTIYNQMEELGIQMDAVNIDIFAESGREFDSWLASPRGNYSARIHIPDFGFGSSNALLDARENGVDFFVYKSDFGEKNRWFNFAFEHTDFRYIPEDRKQFILAGKFWNAAFALAKHSAIQLNSYTLETFPERDKNILQRFGNAFEQSYVRFLDLQKAEVQAREAQIEVALEKVRSRTMGMQKSEELEEVGIMVFSQMKQLGIEAESSWFWFIDAVTDSIEIWLTHEHKFIEPVKVNGSDLWTFQKELDSWKRKDPFLKLALPKNEAVTSIKKIFKIEMSQNEEATHFHLLQIRFEFGFLGLGTWREATDEEMAICTRFAKVFEQAYTRFLDLQKAEAQARESQIQLALERVRARTMAMQHSTELKEAALLLFSQIQSLGSAQWACGFNIWDDDRKASTVWTGSATGFHAPFKTDSSKDIFKPIYEAAQRGESLIVIEQSGKELEMHYEYMGSIPAFRDSLLEDWKKAGIPIPKFQIFHAAFFSQGYIIFISFEPIPTYHDIFKRFAKVFEQTYTRFLDLQKAEAQAKEAIKQASLDRVRGEIASMRTKDDLNRITPLIWKELIALGVPFIRCGVFIMDEEKRMIHTYFSTPDGRSLAAFEMSFDEEGISKAIVEHWQKKKIYKDYWDKKQFLDFMNSLIERGKVDKPESYQGSAPPPESLYLNFVPFKQGILYAGNTSALEQGDLELVMSLADSFSIAYARYEDFKQLEEAKTKTEFALKELKATQTQLIQSEKMASLGELTAGIAHEIQNPLNFVNNFSEVSKELIVEMNEELAIGTEVSVQLAKEIAGDIERNLEKINHHGQRASDIVKGMLAHSRTNSGVKELTDINALADEYLRLSYHGLRAKDKSFNADFKLEADENLPKINVIPQDIGRVLLNLINNAFYACAERSRSAVDKRAKELTPLNPPEGGTKNDQIKYEPKVTVSTSFLPPSGETRGVRISVKDNGDGIPENIVDKIFQPFFTTKPTGSGTGLGLSLSYDIVKAHGGEINVESMVGKGSEFKITIPNT